MSSSCTKQRRSACSTCPWITDNDLTQYFPPESLERSTVAEMQRGNIHPCHKAEEFMCSGYLAFAEKNLPFGVDSLGAVRVMERLGAFDRSLVNPDLKVFKSVKAMLKNHKMRGSALYALKNGGISHD
jgi:Family of unknown function (DUF6283)